MNYCHALGDVVSVMFALHPHGKLYPALSCWPLNLHLSSSAVSPSVAVAAAAPCLPLLILVLVGAPISLSYAPAHHVLPYCE